MISSKLFKAAATGLVCFAGSSIALAQPPQTDAQFWNQPHIKKAWLGSYELNTTLEPSLTQEEQVIVKNIISMVTIEGAGEAEKKAALQTLLPSITPTSTAAFDFIAANFYAEQANYEKAIEYYDKSIDKFPNFLRSIKNSAIMKVRLGKYEAALKQFTKAIELGAKDTTTMGLLGLCYVNTEKYFSAESAYREAILLDPSVKDWQVGLAKSLLQQQKWDEAIAVLEQILVEEPENEILWSSAANAYLGKNDPETAVAIQEIVDRLGKATPDTLLFMGNIYLSRNLNDLALGYFERAIKMDPNQDPEVHVNIAETLTARGAYDQAKSEISTIRSTFGDTLAPAEKLRVLRLEAQIALATQQGERVIPILEELIEQDPLDGQALLLLADYYSGKASEEGYARADLYYERATKVSKWEVRALISWARSYVSRERFGKAIPLLERAQVKEPQDHIGRYLDQVRKVHLAALGL